MSHICAELHQIFAGLPHFGHSFPVDQIPKNGIYVYFENGEMAHGTDRIVRIGTHRGADRLGVRLKLHHINGNRHNDIFRKNIGRAILNRDKKDILLQQWNIDLIPRANREKYAGQIDMEEMAEIEKQVEVMIKKNFHFVVFPVKTQADRIKWEQRLISTVNHCQICHPSESWFGRFSPVLQICESGLWNFQGLNGRDLNPAEFEELRRMIESGETVKKD